MTNQRILAAMLLASSLGVSRLSAEGRPNHDPQHVLLISIDGMHALDYENCVAYGTCPNLAELGRTGVNYVRTSTSKPSDSFPGLMAIVTGGTPKLVGAYYDVAYDRILAPPATTTGNGVAAGTCTAFVPNGTRTEYEEGVELDQTKLNGGYAGYGAIEGGVLSIDPGKLPRDPFDNCSPVYPWNFIRANTIFGVLHEAGRYTAWSDKHPVYAAVSGPTFTSSPSNLDDFYGPEINSNLVNLPGVTTATGMDCSTIPDNTGGDWTTSFKDIQCYDQLKVNAVLNWISGRTHLGTGSAVVPAIFGMNFQSVSVGQKLIENGTKGGYTDGAGTPTPAMLGAIQFVDAAIGQMVTTLRNQGLLNQTTIIVTAKHGQSPVDTNRFFPIPGHSGSNGTPPSTLIASYLPDSEINGIGPTEDDISLLWLNHTEDTLAAVGVLETNAAAAVIGQIFYNTSLALTFGSPGLPPNGDPRTPDIIVAPHVGVIYTGSLKKQAEHGGFANDDTNVMLLVSNPFYQQKTVTTFVETTQVAPTVLKLLGQDPQQLDAVRIEGTAVLPGLWP